MFLDHVLAQICLKLAKDPKLQADFKAQVARLPPDALATLQAGLRAAMSTGVAASPVRRGRATPTSSARKPAIALRMDFG